MTVRLIYETASKPCKHPTVYWYHTYWSSNTIGLYILVTVRPRQFVNCILCINIIIIIIIRQPLCPVVGRRPQHAVSKLPCLVLSAAISCRSSICLGRLSTAWLVSLVVFSCHMVSKWWHARSIGRLWGGWYVLPRTISFFLQCWL